jgi:hypothetical protein
MRHARTALRFAYCMGWATVVVVLGLRKGI